MIEFVALRSKSYSHFTDDGDENKNVKDTKGVKENENLNLQNVKIV